MKTADERGYKEPSLTFEECKAIFKKDGENYNDEEIEGLRQLILGLVRIEYMNYLRSKMSADSHETTSTGYKQAS